MDASGVIDLLYRDVDLVRRTFEDRTALTHRRAAVRHRAAERCAPERGGRIEIVPAAVHEGRTGPASVHGTASPLALNRAATAVASPGRVPQTKGPATRGPRRPRTRASRWHPCRRLGGATAAGGTGLALLAMRRCPVESQPIWTKLSFMQGIKGADLRAEALRALTAIGVADPVHRDILVRRLGLRGRPMTLQAIGERHSYTKQRIQQIESDTARLVKTAAPPLPCLDRALALVRERVPIAAESVRTILQNHGIGGVDCERLMRLADFFNRPHLELQTILGTRMVCEAGRGEGLRNVTEIAERLGWRFGLFTPEQIQRQLNNGLDTAQIRDLLASLSNYRFVDGGMVYSRRLLERSSLMLNLNKVFCIRSELAIDDVAEGVNRARRQKRKKPPLPVTALRSFFEQESDFRLDHDIVRRRKCPRPEKVLCSSELGLLEVFRSANAVTLSFEDAVHEACLREGISREAAVYYLQHSPIIKKHGRGRYSLRS